jgi:uncharacterized protein (TIGR02300 family)
LARAELGTKRICPTTGRKFYDLNRDPIVSPYTGEVLARSAFEPVARSSAPARAAVAEPADDDEADVMASGAEVISLEDVAETEESTAAASDDEAALEEEEAPGEDTFLEEEEGSDDVADLIDGDIEEEEEG